MELVEVKNKEAVLLGGGGGVVQKNGLDLEIIRITWVKLTFVRMKLCVIVVYGLCNNRSLYIKDYVER